MERVDELPTGTLHLDTVRSLHQTVVSLRTALELSKNELKQLKEKYQQHTQCKELTDVIEKLTIENHILRRKIIDSDYKDSDKSSPNVKFQVSYTPRSQDNSQITDFSSEVIIKTATPDISENISKDLECVPENQEEQFDSLSQSEQEIKSGTSEFSKQDNLDKNESYDLENTEKLSEEQYCSTDYQNTVVEKNQIVEYNHDLYDNINSTEKQSEIDEADPNLEQELSPQDYEGIDDSFKHESHFHESKFSHENSFKTKLELLSKFDVRIKVRTLKEGTITSSNTSETDSTLDERKETRFQGKKDIHQSTENNNRKFNLKSVSGENIKMAVPNETDCKNKTDKFDVQVKITSEENLVVKEHFESTQAKDNLNLDVDDLSLRSMSEGDNSVFGEGFAAMNPNATAGASHQDPEGSDNESEEVDDIELIFTTDESKDMSQLQEDLVSIREADQWAPSPTSTTHSTPVLIKFHTLDPDFQPTNTDSQKNEDQEIARTPTENLKFKRVSLPTERDITKDMKHVMFSAKSLDLPGRGILKSMDNKCEGLYRRSPNASSKRLDSMDSLSCDYKGLSFDNTKSSSFEMGSSMDMLQRDGSTEAFRNRYLGHRFSMFAETDISKCGISEDDISTQLNFRRNTCPNPFQYKPPLSRSYRSGPMRASLSPDCAVRPVLRDPPGNRTENAAQTDLSALPARWSSDGYLAHKVGLPLMGVVPTLPYRTSRRMTSVDTRCDLRPDRNEMARRQLLSDLGFTSMVPELSRSAEPVWARTQSGLSPTPTPSTVNTSKLFSRGSSYQSASLSVDRSNDWIPQNVYVPPPRDVTVTSRTMWCSSLPDVRRDCEYVTQDTNVYLRRSIDNLRGEHAGVFYDSSGLIEPYIPSEPRQLRLGHTVKVISPQGRIAVGRVRYVGIAGGTSDSSVMVGGVFPQSGNPGLPLNDGTYRQRRYFHTPPHHTALFVPFNKVVMAWAHHDA